MQNFLKMKNSQDASKFEANVQNELLKKYVSEDFVRKDDVNIKDVSAILKHIRIQNTNNVIIAHLNINSIAPKLDAINTIITDNIDIMIFGETKLDDSYTTAQLLIPGFRKPFRLGRNANAMVVVY